MGVKRTWHLTKVASLTIPASIRESILNDLTRREDRQIRVYAWRVNETTAELAFLTKTALLKEWARVSVKRLLSEGSVPATVKIVEWDIPLKHLPKYIKEKQLKHVPLVKEELTTTEITPPKTLLDEIKKIKP